MKKFLALVVFVFSPSLHAQETLWPTGLAITAAQQAKVDDARIQSNGRTCERNGLDAGCSQAEVAAAGKGGTIYADSTAGRQAFIVNEVLVPTILNKSWSTAEINRLTWWKLTKASRDSICTALGKASGCVPFNQ